MFVGQSLLHRQRVAESHFGNHCHTCPLAGKRAPELAAGHIMNVMDSMARKGAADLMSEVSYLATPEGGREELDDLLQTWHSATAHLKLVLRTKTDFWQRMPWLLCGLAHNDQAEAQRVARDVINALDTTPDKTLHHRVAHQFMFDGPLHGDLCRFAE
eukprot:4126634-Pyramimonas_sp.AAC.1